jgi:hypothetical protein
MPYELTLRPRSTEPICKERLRQKLVSVGLKVHPDSVAPGMLSDDFAPLEIIADPQVPAGVTVLIRIPYCRDFFDLTLELLNLERIAGMIDADMLDGSEVMVHSGREGLASLFAFHTRYERASKCAAAVLGVACG